MKKLFLIITLMILTLASVSTAAALVKSGDSTSGRRVVVTSANKVTGNAVNGNSPGPAVIDFVETGGSDDSEDDGTSNTIAIVEDQPASTTSGVFKNVEGLDSETEVIEDDTPTEEVSLVYHNIQHDEEEIEDFAVAEDETDDEGNKGGNAETTWIVEEGESVAGENGGSVDDTWIVEEGEKPAVELDLDGTSAQHNSDKDHKDWIDILSMGQPINHDHDEWIDILSIDWGSSQPTTSNELYLLVNNPEGNSKATPVGDVLSEVPEEQLMALLLPAVSAAREAASDEDGTKAFLDVLTTVPPVVQVGLLLPAVQKAHEAAADSQQPTELVQEEVEPQAASDSDADPVGVDRVLSRLKEIIFG